MKANWQKPITTRRYIHCPRSERMYTLWSEGKIIFGEMMESFNGEKYWDEVLCSGIWFCYGENKNQFNFRNTVNHFRKDGIPIHSVEHSADDISVCIEAISNICRKPTCFIKVTLTNKGQNPVCEKLGFYLRSGLEGILVFGAPDNYTSYNPDLTVWKEHKSDWTANSDAIRNGEEFVTVKTDFPFSYDNQNGYGEFEISLEKDEQKEIYLSFGKGEIFEFDYNTELSKTVKYWESELQKLKLPEKVNNNPTVLSIIKNLTIQILQNFCYYPNWEYLVLRQGGLQRRIWLWEAMCALKVLPTIGEYDDYVDDILKFYFEKLQQDNGEVVTLGEPWANATASALQTFVPLALKQGKKYFEKYRENVYKAFKWIKETRALSATMDNMVDGFFPSMQGSDAKVIFQNWWFTDTCNIAGLRQLLNLFEHFGDSATAEIKAEYDDYMAVYKKYIDIARENSRDKEYLYIPLSPNGDTEEFRKSFAFDGLIVGVGSMMAETEEDMDRIYKLYDLEGRVDHDHGMMCTMMRPGASVSNPKDIPVWYVGSTEYSLYFFYKKFGNLDKMKACLESTYKFSITEEYYMVERYSEKDPYFAPWSPNVSENGRFIEMLCDYLA